MPTCQTVDISFLETATVKEVNTVEIKASPELIFKVWEDPDTWPEWFDSIKEVVWTSQKPYGVGSTRIVDLGHMKVWEQFIIWEQNKHIAFFFYKTSIPFVTALIEDYKLEIIDESTTRFIYTVAYDPRFPLALTGPIGKAVLRRNFRKAAEAFVPYMEKRNI